MKHLLITLALLFTLATAQAQPVILATLRIDAIELDAPIIESQLDHRAMWIVPDDLTVGRLYGTAQLGASGNVGLAGHVALDDGSAGIFARLHELETGDPISITLADGAQLVYLVTERYVTDVQDLTPLYPTTDDRLTLVTCYGDDYAERLIVIASRED